MGIIKNFFGPKSKYDKTLPYTYEAKVDVLCGQGESPVYRYCISDTICGLLGYLHEQDISPDFVELNGVYLGKEIALEVHYCINRKGQWLKPPELCKSLEGRYKQTMEERYKGHVASGECSFEDRFLQKAF